MEACRVKDAKNPTGDYGEGIISSPLRLNGNMLLLFQVLRDTTENFNEENILGECDFWIIYKVELQNGRNIIVKKMQLDMVDVEVN